MKILIKKLARKLMPASIRSFLWACIPKFHLVNTYLLKKDELIQKLSPIKDNFLIREVGWEDLEKLKKAELYRNPKKFKKKIIPRLKSPAWNCLAVFDNVIGDIAYLAWVIDRSISYFEEFGIKMNKFQFLIKDGFCVPHYRHQGLHTRMEQERINYCIKKGATEIFIQIHNSNLRGIASVSENGYKLFQQDYIIEWSIFNTYRSFRGFLKNPFKILIK